MSIVAAIRSEIDQNVLGLKSRALEEIDGRPILEHVVRKLKQCPEIKNIVLFSKDKHPLSDKLQSDYGVRCEVGDLPDLDQREAMIRSRKWSLEAWRGGAFYTMRFDEN